jgi:hypothetical protein
MRGYFKETLKQVPRELIYALVILIVVVGGGSLLVSIREDIPATWYIPLAVTTVFLALASLNAFYQLRLKLARNLSSLSDEKIEATLRDWLFRFGFTIGPASDADSLFRFSATDPEKRLVLVARLKDQEKFLVFAAVLRIQEEDTPLLAGLAGQPRAQMLEDLRIEFARFGIAYRGVRHPLKAIQMQHIVPLDGLTELGIVVEISYLRRAMAVATELIKRAIRNSEVAATSA